MKLFSKNTILFLFTTLFAITPALAAKGGSNSHGGDGRFVLDVAFIQTIKEAYANHTECQTNGLTSVLSNPEIYNSQENLRTYSADTQGEWVLKINPSQSNLEVALEVLAFRTFENRYQPIQIFSQTANCLLTN